MRSLEHARVAAREEREKVDKVGLAGDSLLTRLEKHFDSLGIGLVAMSSAALEGGRGEITADGLLKYSSELSDIERLELFSHELGHKVLHRRLSDAGIPVDPILASAYSETGMAALARYNPRAKEEAEASAFAMEFLCPATDLFRRWRDDEGATIESLATELHLPMPIIRIQLANGLHQLAVGGQSEPRVAVTTYTDEQKAAARFVGKPALIDAGPGTGKTATLIHRIELLREVQKADVSQFLIVTFSNEAAQELHERVAGRFGAADADAMTISTFHGLGIELLRVHGELAGYGPAFELMDEDGQAELVHDLIGRVACPHLDPLRKPAEVAEKVVKHINHCKHWLIGPEDLRAQIDGWPIPPMPPSGPALNAQGKKDKPEEKRRKEAREAHAEALKEQAAARDLLALYIEYEREKLEAQRVDFADLISLPLRILETNAAVREMYQAKYRWVLVDEFQDVTRATSRLLRAICGPGNPPWVVGDPRQAIYQFLGAEADNVRLFERDFPEAKRFALVHNRRSSEPIVDTANLLASLMAEDGASPKWKSQADSTPLGDAPVSVAVAASDSAEALGVVAQVKHWIDQNGVVPGDIAILARRHIDVRNIVLALTKASISAQAAGMLTAEGAAGDMAAVLTLADRPSASIPRLCYALGRGRETPQQINSTIAYLLEVEARGEEEEQEATQARDASKDLMEAVNSARQSAEVDLHSGDGFVALTTFLFDGADYLRDLLDGEETAERAMSLVEVVSVLSLATAYRATHKRVKPMVSRRGFAARLRFHLTRFVPVPIIPRPRKETVRVMTCHSSKGLEFPCVIVASQTVPRFPEQYPWLPPKARPDRNEDEEQANSLLFVGVTRAKRAVVVSYPTKAGDGANGRVKKPVPLLQRWIDGPATNSIQWNQTGEPQPSVDMGAIWGERRPEWLKPSALVDDRCPIQTYLHQFLGLNFPEGERELYPRCFGALRRVLREMARRRIADGVQMSEADIRELVAREFPMERYKDHPHYEWYHRVALDAARGFARTFEGHGGEVLDPEVEILAEGSHETPVRLDLIALSRLKSGQLAATVFRPESYTEQADEGTLGWSKLGKSKRATLVLAHTQGDVRMEVYSGADGALYEYLPSQQADSLPKELVQLRSRHGALARGDFSTDTDKWSCDQCDVRVNCPHWLGAVTAPTR